MVATMKDIYEKLGQERQALETRIQNYENIYSVKVKEFYAQGRRINDIENQLVMKNDRADINEVVRLTIEKSKLTDSYAILRSESNLIYSDIQIIKAQLKAKVKQIEEYDVEIKQQRLLTQAVGNYRLGQSVPLQPMSNQNMNVREVPVGVLAPTQAQIYIGRDKKMKWGADRASNMSKDTSVSLVHTAKIIYAPDYQKKMLK